MFKKYKKWKQNRITPKKNIEQIELIQDDIIKISNLIENINERLLEISSKQSELKNNVYNLAKELESHTHRTGVGPTTKIASLSNITKLRDKLKERT